MRKIESFDLRSAFILNAVRSWQKDLQHYLPRLDVHVSPQLQAVTHTCYSPVLTDHVPAYSVGPASEGSLWAVNRLHPTPRRSSRWTVRVQAGESGSCYLTELRVAADSRHFATITASEILRDRFVHGLRDAKTRERLLLETNLTLDRAYAMVQAAEVTTANACDVGRASCQCRPLAWNPGATGSARS